MANGWGGKRQGSGRKPGLTSQRALARANPQLPDIPAKQHRENVGLMPVGLLPQAVRNENLDMPLRLAAATKAAPYFYSRVGGGPPKATFEMTDIELDIAIQRERAYLTKAGSWPPFGPKNHGSRRAHRFTYYITDVVMPSDRVNGLALSRMALACGSSICGSYT